MSYFLSTKRIGFRYWTPDDLPIAMELWGDLEVTKFIGGPFSETQIRDRLSKEIATQKQFDIQYWPIFDLTSGEHIGCCGLRPYPKRNNTLELGFHLLPKFWGKGLAKEAAIKTIEYAFSTLHAEALFAGHNPKNEISAIVLEKLGFKFTHDEFYEPTGLKHPSYLLARERTAEDGL